MCGDMEEDGPSEAEDRLYQRFQSHTRTLLAQYAHVPQDPGADLHAYMDKLFADALSRAARDGDSIEAQSYQRLAAQPLVFARLAGFLAAHLSLRDDPLRKVIEAVMLGYAEAEATEFDHGHDHDHDHQHGHGHDHHH
jgi:hypothetical protein